MLALHPERISKESLARSSQQLEGLELSTRLLIEEALRRGVEVEVLDRTNNFIRLSRNGHVHLARQATKTAVDSYMTFLIMENKEVSKQILRESAVRVPAGAQASSPQQALQWYANLRDTNVVVKPSTTNFGIGVSFLSAPIDAQEYQSVVEQTFQHDTTIIIEEWIPGEEYRFLVVDYTAISVCQRVPANVVGNGIATIEALVDKKNEDPRRGTGHRKPLEKLTLGPVERAELQKQDLQIHSIPEKNQQVFLRKNSNISTGGDSIDRTDDVHPSYLAVAEQAAKAVSSRITGVDIMIKDLESPASENNHAVIELNFNPVLFIHEKPYLGTSRPASAAVLDCLGFPE